MRFEIIFVLAIAFVLLAGCAQQPQSSSRSELSSGVSSVDAQKVSVRALNTGLYDKTEVTIKAGQPVEFTFSADKDSGCGRQLLIPKFGVNLVSQNGEPHTVTFTPKEPGVYEYHCGMNMFRGKLLAK